MLCGIRMRTLIGCIRLLRRLILFRCISLSRSECGGGDGAQSGGGNLAGVLGHDAAYETWRVRSPSGEAMLNFRVAEFHRQAARRNIESADVAGAQGGDGSATNGFRRDVTRH